MVTTGRLFIFSAALLIAGGCTDKADIEKELAGRLSIGDLGTAPCANVDLRVSHPSPIAGVLPELLPGAGRIRKVLDPSNIDYMPDRPALIILTNAGYFSATEGEVDGKKAREFELTPKGYLAMDPERSGCFVFQKMDRVEVLKVDSASVPDGAFGGNKVARVTVRTHFATVADWAKTDEFEAVFRPKEGGFGGLMDSRSVAAEQSVIMVKMNDRWRLEQEAAALMQFSKMTPEQAEVNKKYVERLDPAQRSLFLSKPLRSMVDESIQKSHGACFRLQQASVSIRMMQDRNIPWFAMVVTKLKSGASFPDGDLAAHFIARVKAAGLVTREEQIEGEPGMRYYLQESLRDAYSRDTGCLSLGKMQVVDASLFPPQQGGYVPYRAWVKVSDPPEYAKALAEQFPHVRVMLEKGFGVHGRLMSDAEQGVWVRSDEPKFAVLPVANPMDPPVATENATAGAANLVTQTIAAPLKFVSDDDRCVIASDGAELSATIPDRDCGYAQTAPRIKTGRIYVELKFTKPSRKDEMYTWSKLDLVNERAEGKLPRVGAQVWLASGSGSSTRQLRDGDVLGIAIDQEAAIAYIHLNGAWQTGRPGSAVGKPLSDGESFFSIALGESERLTIAREGATKYPVPAGYLVAKVPVVKRAETGDAAAVSAPSK